MKKPYLIIFILPFFASTSTSAAEAGVGRDTDTPDATPPTDPAPAQTPDSFMQHLLETFGVEVRGEGQ